QQSQALPKWIVDKRAEFAAKYEATNQSSADGLFELHMWAAQWPEALGKEAEDLLYQVMKLSPGHVNGLNRVKAVHTDKLLEARGADSEEGWLSLAEFCDRFGLVQECAYAAEYALKRNPTNARAKEFFDRVKKAETDNVEKEMEKELAEAQAEAEKIGTRRKRINELCGGIYREVFGVVPVWEWEKRETYREGKAKGWSLRDYAPYVIFLEEGSYSADTVFEWIYGNIDRLLTQFRATYPDAISEKTTDDDFVGVFIFKDRESYLEKTGVKEYAAAFYSPQKRALFIPNDPDVGERDKVLFHEGTHQLVDFAAGYGRGGRPFWFEEGMATHFEALGRGGSGDPLTRVGSDHYLTGIKAAMRDKKFKPFAEMLAMDYRAGQSSDEQRSLNYAQSWSIVYFLYSYDGGKYRGKWKEYFTAELGGRGGVKTFSDIFGDVGAIEKEWLVFMPQVMSD
ncbi:MAG: DUF1570 domain-containing protein, partial [Planctomycetota bacterium]|nr:DUF1570 domain-containing protein [Planctomycetota bacterium]